MGIRIEEYQRKYAAGLAKMWNMSADSWGGFDSERTEETVIQENEGSENLKTWLALDGDEVVGFCSFSEYREDDGASYIPLLNVRPDYHSKKVGKALVLKAVEQACTYDWPRLDLYTWPGNTKATPLYKKCGFFWEDRDDTTHLMNFIPYVMQTEAVADFFAKADWYRDSVREIKVEPDGRKENGFEYLGYHWQHDGDMLRMEFERRARGLRLIETTDWLVEANIENLNLPFGLEYKVECRLVNKTGKPLEVSIKGVADKNVSFDLERTLLVEDETVVEGNFHVGEIDEAQNDFRTHPGVAAKLWINGKEAFFKVGLVPKFPAMLTAVVPEKEFRPGSQGQFYLNLENNFHEPVTFEFSLPQADFINLEQKHFSLRLEGEQKLAVPVAYSLQGLGLLAGKVAITAKPQRGGSICFERSINAPFAGAGAFLSGETDDYWFIINGRNKVTLSKFNNMLELAPVGGDTTFNYFLRPQLGQPYSVEFAKTKPVRVESEYQDGVAVLRAFYQSKVNPGIEIERRFSLERDGIAQQVWRVTNTGSETSQDLWFRPTLRLSLQAMVAPMGGKIVESRDGYGDGVSNLNFETLDENWIYSQDAIGRGLCWSKDVKPVSANGMFNFDEKLGRLEPGQSVTTKPVILALGSFRNWQEFRNFALGQKDRDVSTTSGLNLEINGGNPFVSGTYELAVEELRNVIAQGDVRAWSARELFTEVTESVQQKRAATQVPGPAPSTLDVVSAELNSDALQVVHQAAVFGIGGKVSYAQNEIQGQNVYTVDNGAIHFSAAPEFGSALYSLKYNGREWLDTSFPTPSAKSWWNPWLGGSKVELEGLSTRSMLRSPRSLKYVERQDSVGNQWQGVQMQMQVEEHPKFKGLLIRHNILTLPGFQGLAMVIELEHSGLVVTGVQCLNEVFLAPAGKVEQSWVELGPVRYKQGSGRESHRVNKLLYGTELTDDRLLAVSATDITFYTNKDVMIGGSWEEVNIIPGRKLVTMPLFFIFTQHDLEENTLEALKKIRF